MTEMKEYFIDVPGYEGYYKISNLGNVLGVRRGKLLNPNINRRSSKSQINVSLCANGVVTTFVLSTLMFLSFFGRKPNGMIEFNDGDHRNCSIHNIREVSMTAAFSAARCKKVKDKSTGLVFSSATELAAALRVTTVTVSKGISKNQPKYRSYEYV